MKKIPVILDGDPGHDDAIAWVLANSRQELDILAVTTVGGNQTLAKTTYNAGRVMSLIGLDVPRAAGRAKPFFCDLIVAPGVHGVTGLDGPELPEPARDIVEEEAVELMARILEKSDEPIVLVPTGPLTNIASLLLLRPDLKEKIKHIYMMGGGITKGNWAGLDVTEKALVHPEDIERIRSVGNEIARIVAGWLEFFYQFHQPLGYEGAPVHDAVAIVAIVRPDLLTMCEMYVEVELIGEYTRGATVGDIYGYLGRKPNVTCIMDIDREAFIDLLVESVASYGEVTLG